MYESTQKMQSIQPLVMEVQRKYKSDKNRMNTELRKLYKENKVNPMGGCLLFFFKCQSFLPYILL